MLEMGGTLPEAGRESISDALIDSYGNRVKELIAQVINETGQFVGVSLDAAKKDTIYKFINIKDGELSLLASEIWRLVSITNLMPQESEDVWHQGEYYSYNLKLRNMHNTLITKRLELKHLLGDENPDLLASK